MVQFCWIRAELANPEKYRKNTVALTLLSVRTEREAIVFADRINQPHKVICHDSDRNLP